MAEFRMPSLGADMEEGTILEWRVQPGDTVHRGQIVALVETEKADIEVEVFTDGVVADLVVPVGTKVPVGTVLAHIGDGAPAPAAAPPAAAPEPKPAPEPAVAPEPEPEPSASRPVSSPLVRHLAEELHVSLDRVTGTGKGGRITRADVERAAAHPTRPERRPKVSPRARRLAARGGEPVVEAPVDPAVEAALALTPTPAPTGVPAPVPAPAPRVSRRQAVGRVMARSKREIPHYYLSIPIDLHDALAWLDARNADRSVADQVLPAALLLHAVARAAAQHPLMNGTFDAAADAHVPSDHVDLAVAVALREGGLVAPVIAQADTLSLDELMTALKGLVMRTRRNALRGSDLVPGTLTVTSLGDASPGAAGVAQMFPVITPPQVAAIGLGAIREEAVAHEGLLGVRPVVWCSLAADHRVSDGRDGARFLAALDHLLTHPDALGAHDD